MNTYRVRSPLYLFLLALVFPIAASAHTCSPSPISCPTGQTMLYTPSGDNCPNGGYICGAAPRPIPQTQPAQPTAQPRPTNTATPQSSDTLSFGSRGAAVTLVQQQLATLGFLNPSSISGYFGALTRTAVRAFQSAKGIVSSGDEFTTGYGAVGPRTKTALTLAVREHASRSSQNPLPDAVPPTILPENQTVPSPTPVVPDVSTPVSNADLSSLTDIVTRPTASASAKRDAAKRRAAIMQRLGTENPREFLRNVMSASARAKLPSDVQADVEQQKTLAGQLEVLHVDDFTRPEKSRFEYWLRSGKSRYKLGIADRAPEVASDASVSVVGYAVGDTVVANGANVQVVSAPAAGLEATGPQRTLVILITAAGRPTPPTKETIHEKVFSGVIQQYFAEQSYGRASLTGMTTDWITVPEVQAACASQLLDKTEVKDYLLQNGIAPSSYDRVMYVVNGMNNACAFVGKTDVAFNGGTVRLSQGWAGWPNMVHNVPGAKMTGFEAAFAHELGHGLGLVHAASWFCSGASYVSGCTETEYGNRFDLMGFGFHGGHFGAFAKDRLSWLLSNEKVNITTPGRYTLQPFENQSGVRAAIIQNPNHQMNPLYVEYREPLGFDATSTVVGLHINEAFAVPTGGAGNNAAPRPRLLNANQLSDTSGQQPLLRPGGTFDYAHRAIVISGLVIDQTGASFDVAINGATSTPLGPTPSVEMTVNGSGAVQAVDDQKLTIMVVSTGATAGCSLKRNQVLMNDNLAANTSFEYVVKYTSGSETQFNLNIDCFRERPPLTNGIASDSIVVTRITPAEPPVCSVVYSPTIVRKDQTVFINWTSNFATSRSYVIADASGKIVKSVESISVTGSGNDTSFRDLPAGTYKRTDTVIGAGGPATCNTSFTVQSVPVADQARAPIGTIDVADCSAVEGWAFDQDTPDQIIDVHMYVDGAAGTGWMAGSGSTSIERTDVNAAYTISGTHGFRIAIPESLKDGRPHTIWIHGIDSTGKAGNHLINGSGAKTIRCGDLDERRKPVGVLDAASCNVVEGWVYDPDTTSKSAEVHFYIDTPFGAGGGATTANTPRSDVHAAYGVGTNHGFVWQVPQNLKDGRTHKVYAYGIDTTVADVNNVLLGGSPKIFNCSVTGPIDEQNRKPIGTLDTASCDGVEGWVLDYDTPESAASVHFYVDGWNAGGSAVANTSRPDVNAAFNVKGNHGFSWKIPAHLRDGKTHTLHAYGIDTTVDDVNNVELSGSQKTFRCGPQALSAPNSNLANALTALESLLKSFLGTLGR